MSQSTEFHCVMTIQSIWNGEPHAAATHAAVLPADSPTGLYEQMLAATKAVWGRQHWNTSMGTVAVMHWSATPIQPTATAPATAAETAAEPVVQHGEQASVGDLALWLVENGYAEESAGYGHVDGLTLAEAITGRFAITHL